MSMLRQLCPCFDSVVSLCALRLSLSLCALCLLGDGSVHADDSPDGDHKVRMILSSESLTDINVNDATAAFSVWMREFGRKMNTPVAKDAIIFSSMEAIASEMDQYRNHLVSLSLPEYLSFDSGRFSRSIYLTRNDGDRGVGERYLLLVHESSPIPALAELSNKKLVQYVHLQTIMAQEWLDYQLAEAGQVSSVELLMSYTKDTNLSNTVLGVFFGKIDACIVSDRSFDLLCELNPQLRLKLRVLAQSPVVVGGATFTQSNYDPHLEMLVGQSLQMLGDDLSGKQLLTMLRADSVYRADLSELQASIDLYTKWTSVREVAE